MNQCKTTFDLIKDELKIVSFGPHETYVDTRFNQQLDGSSALWFEIEDSYNSDLVVEFDGLYLKSTRNDKVVSAIVPDVLLRKPRAVKIRIIDEVREERTASAVFTIIASPGCDLSNNDEIYNNVTPEPNFFIVGAPRSGTTSMYWKLRAHPRIHMSRIKEPFYFDERSYGVLGGAVTDELAYKKLFKFTPFQSSVIGEASTIYLSSPAALKKIKKNSPDAKILVMLRNPVTASVSLYLQHRKGGIYEKAEDFQSAWNECGVCSQRKFIADYKQLYRIGEQLTEALSIFGNDNLKVLLYDDLIDNSASVYLDLLQYLSLEPDNKDRIPVSNSAGWNDIHSFVSDNLLNEMIEYFSPEVEKVSNCMNRDLGHWFNV